jgi:hypothetical protein
MADDQSGNPRPNEAEGAPPSQEHDEGRAQNEGQPRKASEDLAEGLELMLRAAKKALGGVDQLNRRKIEDLGRRAAKNLDPRRIEDIAEDAGRELVRVVERVADRIESAIAGTRSTPPGPSSEPESEERGSRDDKSAPRVRVSDDDTKP